GDDNPTLIDDSAKAIQPCVLIAGIAVRFTGLLDVGEIDTRLRMGALHDSIKAKVRIGFQSRCSIDDRSQPAYGIVQTGRVIVIQNPAIGIRHADHPAVIRIDSGTHALAGLTRWLLNEPAEAVTIWRKGVDAEFHDEAGGMELPVLLLYAAVRAPNLYPIDAA